MNTRDRLAVYRDQFQDAIRFAFSSWKTRFAVVGVSIASFTLFVALTFPQYAFEMGTAGLRYWDNAFFSLIWLMKESSGILGVSLVVIYSLVTGILTVVVAGQVRYQSKGSGGFLTVLPAILFSGCASCGAGLLGVIGAFGFASIFPFEGNLVRGVGIITVLVVLTWIGDPQKCRI